MKKSSQNRKVYEGKESYYQKLHLQSMLKGRDLLDHMQILIIVLVAVQIGKNLFHLEAKIFEHKEIAIKLMYLQIRKHFLTIQLLLQIKLTPSRTAAQIVGATLSTASDSAEVNRLTLSHSSLHRRRDKLRLSSDKIITENWKKNNENYISIALG